MADYTIDLKLTDALPLSGAAQRQRTDYLRHGGLLVLLFAPADDRERHGERSRRAGRGDGPGMDGSSVGGNFLTLAGSGWDWYSIQTHNHTEYMFYIIRDSQKRPLSAVGTYVAADGSAHEIPAANFHFEVLDHWTSPATGGVYPSWLARDDQRPRRYADADARPARPGVGDGAVHGRRLLGGSGAHQRAGQRRGGHGPGLRRANRLRDAAIERGGHLRSSNATASKAEKQSIFGRHLI